MHFDLDSDQQAITEAVGRILRAEAGPERVRALGGDDPAHDGELAGILREQGYLGFPIDDGDGPLQAALVIEATAEAAGVVATGAEALVAPGALPGRPVTGPVAIAMAGTTGPIRFAADAATLLVVDDDDVTVVDLGAGDATRVRARFGYPMATVHRWDGETIAGAGPTALSWWRVALAVEIVGTARAALDLTIAHVRDRQQFGRSIGSFQGVQHRLAECEVLVQGARWLALEAAWSRSEPERAAAALTQALRGAERVFWDTHQFSGALGFATEYDLHLWTMRLPALRAEAMAMGSAAAALTRRRWGKVAG